MNILFKYLRLFALSTSGALLLCIVFAANPEIAEGATAGKVFWFHFTILLLAFSVLFMEVTVRKNNFTFTLPDALLLCFCGLILTTYNYEVNPSPEKLLFTAQLTMLWFMLRAVMQTHPELRLLFVSVIICTAVFEAIWGIRHLYGDSPSEHSLFSDSGLVFSETSFSGYLAIVLPVCLNLALRFHNCDKIAWWDFRTMIFYLAVAGIIFILIAFPGGANRPAWLAAVASCGWIILVRKAGWRFLKQKAVKYSTRFIIFCIIMFMVIASLPTLDSSIYPEKSAKRILIWNVTTQAILERPFIGTGLGGFPVTYAEAQANYFSSGKASNNEREIACCPDSAFNEYLQIGLETGIIGLLLFSLWIGFTLYYGVRNKQTGATGAIVALLFFAMYSYPLHFPAFWVLLVFFSAMCVSTPVKQQESYSSGFSHIGTFAALTACVLFFGQRNYYASYKEWKTLKNLIQKNDYKTAAEGYLVLYPLLSHRTEFLLEGAKCFKQNKEYANAIIWSRKALQQTADPEFYYIMAECQQHLGLHTQAEKSLLHCLCILPGKIETCYQLAKLYSDTTFYQPDKLKSAAYSVLSKRPAIPSGNTRSMKEEIQNLLQQTK